MYMYVWIGSCYFLYITTRAKTTNYCFGAMCPHTERTQILIDEQNSIKHRKYQYLKQKSTYQLIEQCLLFLFGFTLPLSASNAAAVYVVVASAVGVSAMDVSVVFMLQWSPLGNALMGASFDGDRDR